MVSVVDTAKRALVTLIKSLAAIYSVTVTLTRDSADSEVKAAYKKVSRKAHPDQGGATEHQKALNAAKDTWEDALRANNPSGVCTIFLVDFLGSEFRFAVPKVHRILRLH